MKGRNPELMKKISDFVDQYFSDYHKSPSIREIEAGTGINRATAQRYLVTMNDQGMLKYDGANRTIETNRIRKFAHNNLAAPVVGYIRCGTPEQEEENIQEYINLPVSLFGSGDFFILKASGDSMKDARIEDGDMVVIRRQPDAEVGDIVVALDENGCNTLKKYGGIDPETHAAILLYQNQEKYPDKRILVKELAVQGVAKKVLISLQ